MSIWRRVTGGHDDATPDGAPDGAASPYHSGELGLFRPVSGEQLAGDEAPVSGEFPVSGEMPMSGEFPVSGEMPVSGEQPVRTEIPLRVPQDAPGEYPDAGEYPESGEYPVSGEYPLSGEYPDAGEYPESGEYPVNGEYPVSGEYPVNGEHAQYHAAPAPPIPDDISEDELPTTERRGGRNMVAATTVGLSLLGLVLVAAWFHPLAFAVVLYAFCLGAIIEWRRALGRHDREIPLIPIVAATMGMAFAAWFGLAEGLAVALLVGCAGVVAWRVVDERIENTMADSLASMMAMLWIPFLASFLLLMAQAEHGWQRVVIVVVAVVGNDSGGLYAGMAFGKHKFAPRISPKKTWEGAIGGVLLGTGAAATAGYFLLDDRWWLGAVVGLLASAAAIAGDLAESAIKRDMQVKDMSSAIPGHGGIMDRLDSILVAAPVAYLVFAIVLGTT